MATFLAGVSFDRRRGKRQHAALRLVHFFFIFIRGHGGLGLDRYRQRISTETFFSTASTSASDLASV